MRIIAGKYGGRLLTASRDRSIRPTTDRAKQTIFDILSTRIDFERIEVLDLFAGSGSLGLEAVSRGARSAVFVENSARSIGVLEKNIAALGCREQCTVYQAEVFWYLKNARHRFDLIFVDPPYQLEKIADLPTAVYQAGVAKPSAYVVMEHGSATPVSALNKMYEVTKKQFGQTIALIMKTLPTNA